MYCSHPTEDVLQPGINETFGIVTGIKEILLPESLIQRVLDGEMWDNKFVETIDYRHFCGRNHGFSTLGHDWPGIGIHRVDLEGIFAESLPIQWKPLTDMLDQQGNPETRSYRLLEAKAFCLTNMISGMHFQ